MAKAKPMDKILNMMKLNEDDDNYDSYDDEEYEEEPVVKRSTRSNDDTASDKPAKKKAIQRPRRSGNKEEAMEVCVIRPTSVEDGREIVDTLLSNRAVVLNLEGIDVDIAQRIIDFTSGASHAISGNLQKISNSIFIITPSSVEISGDFQEAISGTDSFDVPPVF